MKAFSPEKPVVWGCNGFEKLEVAEVLPVGWLEKVVVEVNWVEIEGAPVVSDAGLLELEFESARKDEATFAMIDPFCPNAG